MIRDISTNVPASTEETWHERAVDDSLLYDVLTSTKTVLVLGAHTDESRAAFYVPEYLHHAGYELCGVNPAQAGNEFFGKPILAELHSAGAGKWDMVDVFRKSEALPGHIAELLALRPRFVWLQQGISNAAFADELKRAGIVVIENRCTMEDHRRLRVAPVQKKQLIQAVTSSLD